MFDWFGKRRREEEAPVAPAVPASPHETELTVPAPLEMLAQLREAEELAHSTLSWLLGAAAPQPADAADAAERKLLQRLDAMIAAPTLPPNLLPRAPAVVPQLLGLLRREQVPRFELARQVAKDVTLAAEVLREAGSAQYGTRPVEGLEDALDCIGETGLRQAMARVLVKPVFQAQTGGLAARAAPRLWRHAETKSAVCSELAADPALRFEAFLAGLMHDAGWMALLRLLDRSRLGLPQAWSTAFDAAMERRRDRLFGRITADWGLTDGLTRLSQRFAAADPAADDPLARLLREADSQCLVQLAAAAGTQTAPAH